MLGTTLAERQFLAAVSSKREVSSGCKSKRGAPESLRESAFSELPWLVAIFPSRTTFRNEGSIILI